MQTIKRVVLAALVGLCLLAGSFSPGLAAIALVDHVAMTPAGNNGGTSGAIVTTGANLIEVTIAQNSPAAPVTLSDSKTNVWTLVASRTDGAPASKLYIYICFNPVVGSGHTFTISGATSYSSMTISAWSGVDTSYGVDQISAGGATTSSPVSPGSITPTPNSGSLIISGASVSGDLTGGRVFSVGSGFTISDQVSFTSGLYFGNATGYLIQGAAAAVNPSWSYPGTIGGMAALSVSFKASGAVGAPVIDTGTNLQFTVNNWSTNSTFTNGTLFQTADINRLCVAAISYNGMASNGSVSTFTITNGTTTLTFAKPSASYLVRGGPAAYPGSYRQTIEIWTADCSAKFNSAAASTTTSMTTSVTLDDAFVSVFAIKGLASVASPFDPNALIPQSAVNASSTTSPTMTYSTTSPDDLLLFVSACTCTTTPTAASGWTAKSSGYNGGGSTFQGQMVSFKRVAATQTSQTVRDGDTTTSLATWSGMMTAITGDAATATSGAMLLTGVGQFLPSNDAANDNWEPKLLRRVSP